MALSKKQQMINGLKKLDTLVDKKELDNLISYIERLKFAEETDLNATLTRFIYTKIILAYPHILTNPKSKSLMLFCDSQIKPIKPGYQFAPKIKL